ncbi:hypothetical protein [Xenorhabdus sp. SGI246]|uniref:hypothetical protein n=1 Tax=Xenorhabdus sp. SGI246 TaxID=3158263 RepID=UPI00349FA6A6
MLTNTAPYNRDEFFPFNQKDLRYHNDGIGKGLCFGISFCLLSHLIYKQRNISQPLCPEESFNLARSYMDKLKISYMDRDSRYNNVIKQQQIERQHDYIRISKNIEINQQNGYGLLSLVRIKKNDMNDRSVNPSVQYKYRDDKSLSHCNRLNKQNFYPYRSPNSDYEKKEFSENHMGVIVWNNSTLFIFDPNCGGYLCHSICGAFNKIMLPQLIDSLIDNMYKRTATHGHCRVKCIHQPRDPKYYLTNDSIK